MAWLASVCSFLVACGSLPALALVLVPVALLVAVPPVEVPLVVVAAVLWLDLLLVDAPLRAGRLLCRT